MEDRKPDGPLRRGWTTGACATAAAVAAYRAIVEGAFPSSVTITLPQGHEPTFEIHRAERGADFATASVIKDAGDDPDITHGAEIVATVRPVGGGAGLTFRAGDGVGTVTLPGLALPPGEPAINPGPRAMMTSALANIADAHGRSLDLDVTVSIPGGETLAEKTMNGRLGIIGGLSILGTTGVVIPYSCASWIHSIHRGIDVARAAGLTHVAAATGSTSEAAVQKWFDLGDQALIDMGDFAGGLLKYLRKHPISRLTLAGGFGKLAKLAQGHLDLHSSRSRLDMTALSNTAARAGADTPTTEIIKMANTGQQALDVADAAGVRLGDVIAAQARATALATVGGDVAIDVLIFDRTGRHRGQSNGR